MESAILNTKQTPLAAIPFSSSYKMGVHRRAQNDRLFWPKSKSYDYLYSDGEALLRNFPVQATISFYDESDSEEEDEAECEEEESDSESCPKPPSHFTCWN
ncbi:hypothetical protein JZ751_023213 [Albula glossodonta]|uniref:Protein ripply1 n=1 Tax=Albula glossodonta TaxID=121402 RepID=A0A8T2PMR2_9TELE|nr:hypothetical protein JZ751_023213 [Albula glossodonta]